MPTAKLRSPGLGEWLGLGWWLVIGVLYVPVSVIVRIRCRHLDRLPRQGPAILTNNHVSHVDPLLVAKTVLDGARRPRFLAKDSIFAVFAVGIAMRAMGHIPVKRGTADAWQSFSAAVEALEHDGVIVLHPEGTITRDPDGWPMNGEPGAARLALLAPDVPVIPVAQWGVQESVDLYRRRIRLFPRPRHLVSVGTPVDLAQLRDRMPTAVTLREITDVLMLRLRADLAELRGVPDPGGPLFRWSRDETAFFARREDYGDGARERSA